MPASLLGDAEQALAAGDYLLALRESEMALQRHRAESDQSAEKDDLNTIGLAHIYRGEYASARQSLEEALNIDLKTGDSAGQVIRLNNLGNIDYFESRYSAADRRYQLARKLLADHARAPWAPRLLARTLGNQAVLLQRIGQYDSALRIYDQIPMDVAASERAQILSNRGTLLRRLGDPYLSLDYYRKATHFFAGGHHADGEIGTLKNQGIVLAFDLDSPQQALELFDLALKRAVKSQNRREILQAKIYLAEALRRLGRYEEAKSSATSALQLAREMKSVEDEWKALFVLGKLEAEPARALSLYLGAISVIESTRSGLELQAMKRDFLADKKHVYDAVIELLVEGPPNQLFEMVEQSRARSLEQRFPRIPLRDLQARLDDRTMLLETWTNETERAVIAISRRFARVQLFPISDVSAIAQMTDLRFSKLIVVPDDKLMRAPLDSMVMADGRMLAEYFAISYLPVAAALPKSAAQTEWRLPWQRDTLAIAVPEGDEGAHPLTHAVEEAQAVAGSASGRSTVLVGASATAENLREPSYPIVHVASHAVANPFSPEGSRLSLGDGPVYLREIYRWKLDQVQLITFSACETENGEFVGGEGIAGFGRALLSAGARASITTLWPVADGPTAQFMKIFYREYRTRSASEALHHAKLQFLHSNTPLRESRYWAAFVLSGDPDVRPPRFIPWWALAAALLVLGSVCAFCWKR